MSAEATRPRRRRRAKMDPRTFVRQSTDHADNLKIQSLSDPVIGAAAHAKAIQVSFKSRGDGLVAARVIVNYVQQSPHVPAGYGEMMVKEMVEEGLFHDHNLTPEVCSRCRKPRPGHLYVHDYEQHQELAEDLDALREARIAAGQAGAEGRWGPQQEADAKEVSKEITKAKRRNEPLPVKPEVIELCEGLAYYVAKNDSRKKKPNITSTWHDTMDKILRLDKYEVGQVKDVIRFAANDHFWWRNIKSPDSLRKSMERLIADMQDPTRPKKGELVRGRSGGRQPVDATPFEGQSAVMVAQAGDRDYVIDLDEDDVTETGTVALPSADSPEQRSYDINLEGDDE